MARRQSRVLGDDEEVQLDMTPMLDVVFILLIFFIVTAQFIKEPGVDIVRPDVDNKATAKPLAILVAIDAESRVFIDKKEVAADEVAFTIKQMREDNPRGKIVVQADVASEAEVLVDLMETINKLDGATVIDVSAKRE